MDTLPYDWWKELVRRVMSVDSHSYELLSREDRRAYDADLKAYRDIKNQFAYAEQQGREEGAVKIAMEIAKKLRKKGMPVSDIVEITGRSESEINSL